MQLTLGYSYHIQDRFFALVNDQHLMSNKENGGYRPHYYCMQDPMNQNLYWAIPISSKVGKYQQIMLDKIQRRGRCDTIVIGRFSGRDCAFLIQNMFPFTDNYVDHVHTDNGVPVVLSSQLQAEISTKAKKVLNLYKRFPNLLFTDVGKIMTALQNNGDL